MEIPKIVIFHTSHTAGTYFRTNIESYYDTDEVAFIYKQEWVEYDFYSMEEIKNSKNDYKFICGHISSEYLYDDYFKDFVKIVNFREPFSNARSNYFYHVRNMTLGLKPGSNDIDLQLKQFSGHYFRYLFGPKYYIDTISDASVGKCFYDTIPLLNLVIKDFTSVDYIVENNNIDKFLIFFQQKFSISEKRQKIIFKNANKFPEKEVYFNEYEDYFFDVLPKAFEMYLKLVDQQKWL